MAWAKSPAVGIEIDLGRSGVGACRLDDLAPSPADLDPSEVEGYGPNDLRAALAGRYGVRFEEVLVSVSCTHALFLAGACSIEPGDAIAVETPGYQAIRHLPSLFGAKGVPFERTLESGWRPDLDRAESLLRRGARALFLSDLHNPTGVGLRAEEVAALGELAGRFGARVVVDEIYREFVPRSARPAGHRVHPAVVSVSGATKAFGFGGVRIGWMLADPAFVATAHAFNDYVTVLVPSPSARLASRLLARLPAIEERLRRELAPRREAFDAWATSEPRVRCVPPDGGLVAFVGLPEGVDGTAFADALAERARVRVVPGEFFGARGYVRVGFGLEPPLVREGLSRFSETLDAFGR